MKRLSLSLLFAVITFGSACACSVCACSAGNQYPGILPQSNINFAALQYMYRDYTSYHDDGTGESTEANGKDIFQTVQVAAKYNVTNRIQLTAFLPFVINAHTEHGVLEKSSGIGDATLMLGFRAMPANNNRLWKHNLLLGGGVKLATGKYDVSAISSGEELPNMQPGTASFDFVASTNYTVLYDKKGLNLDASYIHTTASRNNYKFGNRFSSSLSVFHTFSWSGLRVIPQIGARMDVAGSDYENYRAGIKSDMNGGYVSYCTASAQLYYRSFGLQLSYRKPIAQNYLGGMVNSNFQMESGIYFLF